MLNLKKTNSILHELKNYFIFIIEETPSIVTILAVPAFLGIFVLLPKANNWISGIVSVFLTVFLYVRSYKYLNVRKIGTTWIIYLAITGFLLFMLEAFVILVAIENAKLSFK